MTFSLCPLIDSWVILRYFGNCVGMLVSCEARGWLFFNLEYEKMEEMFMNKFTEFIPEG
jgi:hypothetical protein